MSEISEPRPKCGGGGINADDYDLPLHVVALCTFAVRYGFLLVMLT